MRRALWWSLGGGAVSYERGTPVEREREIERERDSEREREGERDREREGLGFRG